MYGRQASHLSVVGTIASSTYQFARKGINLLITEELKMKRINRICLPVIAMAILCFGAVATAHAATRLTAVLAGIQETPPNGSVGKGYGYVILSDDQTTITVNLGFTGLSANATAGHIHTGNVGLAGPVTFPLAGVPGATSGVIGEQTFSITAAQVTALLASGMYFNVHDATFPGGEIRGQILAASCATAGPIEVESTSGTATGVPTAYATLKDAFDAINLGVIHTGAINAEVCGNTTETTTASVNSGTIAPASYTSLNVYPVGAVRAITGNIVGSIIKLNGADNVTIDGRLNGGNARDLTVSNSSTLGSTAAVWLASVVAGNGATNDTVRNLEVACGATQNTGTNSTIGIFMGGTTISTSAADGNDNDNNRIIANRIIRSRYGIVTRGLITNLNIAPVVTDNIVGPTAFGADQIGKVGIFMQADTGATVSRNTVQFVGGDFANTTAGSDRVGIGIGSESWSSSAPATLTSDTYTVTKNIIHDIVEERTFSAVGLDLATINGTSPTNNLIANNFVYNVRANGTSGDQTVGIGIAGGHTDRVVFNSISITGDVDPAAAASSSTYGNAIRIANASSATHANLTLKNNSILMDVNSNTATLPFFAITINSAGYSFGTGGMDNNNLFVNLANTQMNTGGISATSTAPTGATLFNTLANWKTALAPAQDAASIQADPQYVSNTANLHIAVASPNVNAGVTIAGVSDDIDGQLRVGAPDIGADEPSGVTPPANDIAASLFVSPTSGSTVAAGVAFAPQASFNGVGTATQTNVPVRYRIVNNLAVEVCNVTTTVASIANGQTVTATFPNCTLPAFGAYTIFAKSELVGDANTSNDQINGTLNGAAPFSGTYTVGTGGNFTSLTNTGGIFDGINSTGATGNITINITSDLVGETGTVALNEVAGGFTVTIKPTGAARTITGSSTNSIIRLNGADGVTIDGSLSGGSAVGVGGQAALRNLTVQNTNAAATAGAVMAIMQGGNSANNDAIKNVNVLGQDPTQTLIGIHVGGNAVGAAPTVASNNNVVIDNCSFKRSFIGIYNVGVSAAVQATGNVVSRNDLSATGVDRLRRAGIFLFNHNGIQVFENKIGGIVADEAADAIGIIAGVQNITTTTVASGGISNSTIARNQISGISNTNAVGFSAAGIAIAGDVGQNFVVNNMISGISSPATSPDIVAGIFVSGVTTPASSTSLYYNTISMTGDRGAVAGQIGSYGIAISGNNPVVELKNNIFYTTQTSGGGAAAKSYAIGMTTTTFSNFSSDFNDFWSTGANDGGFRTGSLDTAGTDTVDLPAWRTLTGKDASSLEVDPLFVNPLNDPHLTGASTVRNVGTPIASVTNDIDRQPRPNTGDPIANADAAVVVQVDMGADEFYLTTAAGVSISGRVMTAEGRGITNTRVTVTGNTLMQPRVVLTGRGGSYTITDLQAGETYIVTVGSRRFTFNMPSRVISLVDNITDADFIANP